MFKLNRLVTILCISLPCLGIAKEKPNIIFILADDLGYGEVGFNGQKKIKTPHLDKMAEEGAVFSQFYSGSPVCGPSRASLLYGQHTGHVSIRGNPRWTFDGKKPELEPGAIILPSEMKRLGYATAHFGKWGMNENLESNQGHPLKHGFDEFVGFNTHKEAHYHWPEYVWDGYEKLPLLDGDFKKNFKERIRYADDVFQERALDFIERKADEPFFMYLCYTIPHKGYTVPYEDSDAYDDLDWPVKPGKKGHYEMDRNMVTAIAGMITRMDRYIGEVRAKLEEKGIADNTLVFFTSDNGHEWMDDFFDSNGPYSGKKRSLHDGGIRMPTVAVWPDVIKGGRKIETPLAFWDVLPTFCDINSDVTRAETDGLSFYPALKGEMDKQQKHKVMYWEFNEKLGPLQAVRMGKWKGYRSWNKKQNRFNLMALYNLDKDQSESNDLAKDYPEIAERVLAYMHSERADNAQFKLLPHPNLKKNK